MDGQAPEKLTSTAFGREEPALLLKDLLPRNPKQFFEKIISDVKKLYKVGLVHADLSEFNILNFEDEPVFIDFSQATTLEHPNVDEFLKRDIHNVVKFFIKKGLKLDEKKIYESVIKK